MGIRSEVGIAVNPVVKNKLMEFIEQIGEPDEVIDEKDRFVIVYDSIKWYDETDEDIAALMKWLEILPEDEWGFVEIYPGDFGPVFNVFGTPFKFNLGYDCKVTT